MNLILGNIYIDEMDFQMAKWWFKSLTDKDIKDNKIVSFIIEYYRSNDNNLPCINDIENYFCNVSCQCEEPYEEEKIINLKKHMLFNLGRTLKGCRETTLILEYELLNKKFPDEKEIQEYVRNIREFSQDPVDYFNKDKVDRPASNFTNDMIKHPKEEIKENCSICFEQINKSSYYQLPCSHVFHTDKKECLGDASIEDWFNKNNFCPNCKVKI